MKQKLLFLFLIIGLLCAGWPLLHHPAPAAAAEKNDESHSPRLLVHLLDYLAVDYGGAVRNEKILSISEYKEQLEFVKMVVELSQSLPEVKASPDIQAQVQDLNQLIHKKADPTVVATAARKAQAKVIELVKLPVAPSQWPNLVQGGNQFHLTCMQCHGMEGRGDGPSAPSLATKPANFQDMEKMKEMTPFQVFNTVRLGVPNTPMAAFPNFSDQDTWNLAFYVISLRYQKNGPDPSWSFDRSEKAMSLSTDQLLTALATESDNMLSQKISGGDADKTAQLASLRLHSASDSAQASLDQARFDLQDALADYQAGRSENATKKALTAYVDGVEPVEPRLKANDPQSVTDLEELMGLVRTAINDKKPVNDVKLAVDKALAALSGASQLLSQKASSPWITFMLTSGVLLREGFEAVLLIVALLGVIRASGAKKAARWVHGGWLAAVALGLVAWFFSGWLLNVSGLGRELMEGVTGVITVVILLYIGFWLHSRTEIHRWKAFIEIKVKSAVEEKNLIQLAFISFLAAFREAIETVLFLRAIWLEGGSETKTALGLGVAGAFLLVLLLGWLLLTFSTKIPIKTLFNASSMIMVSLAVILTGKAIHSFQEVDFLPISLSPLKLHFDWLGLYPTRETLLAQAFILLLSLVLWMVGKKAPTKARHK